MYDKIIEITESLSSVIWGTPTITLLVATGIYFTLKTDYFQFKNAGLWLNNTLFKLLKRAQKQTDDSANLTSFQAICTALASTIGTGNISGVAAAISVGGPGTVFWMWISALFGMMTAYSENLLGIFYRKKNLSGQWCGGPMIYISEGLNKKRSFNKLAKLLSVLYCIFLIGASLGIGNMVQTNSISTALKTAFNFPYIFSAVIISTVTYIIISGGLKQIGTFTEKTVPFMALFYIGITICIFISNADNCSYVFSSIIKNAFSIKSLTGAASGLTIKKCISTGFKRGIFSNEAGLGASVTVNSTSNIKEPCEQGMWGIFAVFTDTIIICTLTAFAILSTTVEAYNIDYAIKNTNCSSVYVYLSQDKCNNKARVHLADTMENFVIKLEEVNGRYNIEKTENKTYTNIMKLEKTFDNNNNIKTITLEEIDGLSLVSVVFEEKFGKLSSFLLAAAVIMFSFSTVIGWNFYGAKAIEFLTNCTDIKYYNTIYIIAAFIGAVVKLKLIWSISDIFNGLMAIPNLIALIILSETVKNVTVNYLSRLKGIIVKPMLSAYE